MILQNSNLQQLKAAVISHAEEDVWSRLINLQSYINEATTVFLYVLSPADDAD